MKLLLIACLCSGTCSFRIAHKNKVNAGAEMQLLGQSSSNMTANEACGRTPTHGSSTATWSAWLENPPCEASVAAQALAANADRLVGSLRYDQLPKLGDVDVVVAGSSYLDRFQVGFSMILDRVDSGVVNVMRTSGASSGANAPFDTMLMGEMSALTKFLTYGLLGDRFSYVYWFGVSDQSYWFKAIEWMFGKYSAHLPRLNNKMYVWMNCRTINKGQSVQFSPGSGGPATISVFDDAGAAERAYRATGSVFPAVDVNDELKGCTDGGAGKVFTDGLRPQITVSPTKALGKSGALTGYTLEEYAQGVRRGQEAAIEFLKTHKSTRAVVLCAAGAPCKDPSI